MELNTALVISIRFRLFVSRGDSQVEELPNQERQGLVLEKRQSDGRR